MRSTNILIYGLLLVMLAWGCSSTKEAVVPNGSKKGNTDRQQDKDGINWLQLLNTNRSKLSDIYSSQKHDIPKAFLKQDTTKNTVAKDPFDGYRVQILSTREVAEADSISNQVRLWADTTMTEYMPEVYVFFKQPFFKVHIGDFQTQQRAIELSNILKNNYPEAWVVHDRINPALVPADTTSISLIKQ